MIRHPPTSTFFPTTPLSGSRYRLLSVRVGRERRSAIKQHMRRTANVANYSNEAAVGQKNVGALIYDIGSHTVVRYEQFSDRKSTRLNSSHLVISYAVFCLNK